MARARFRFYEELNDFLPPEQRRVTTEHDFDRRTSIKDMIEALGVPHPEIELIVVNGESVDFDYIVRDGDRVAVYPMFEALDVSAALRIRREPLRDPRFMLDANLGALARYLRLCGFDSRYRNDIDDTTLARTAAEERRILLTRDRDVLKRSVVTHGYFVRPDDPHSQLAAVFRRFDLYDAARPFTRCSACNGELVDVDKARIQHRLKPLTARHYEHFRLCTGCDRIYWPGGHIRGIERLLERLRSEGCSSP
ncbi:MAG: Mut7-C RNAse domain-containing protein [Halofilum sp. (in: g-proteobacteria)]